MPESIFKQVSLDILRLHRETFRSLLATQCCDDCEIHDAVYVTLNGRYYVWLPCVSEKCPKTGILLIEDEAANIRLSWVAGTREIKQKDSVYSRVVSALQRKMQKARQKFHQQSGAYLLELTPQQGRLTTDSKDFSLSPNDLMKALYPATHQLELGEFAL